MKEDRINKRNEYIEKYNIIDFARYDDLFDMLVINKGYKLYKDNAIFNYTYENNKASCNIKGNDTYDLSIEFDKDNNIINMNCTCPYYKKGNNCKHLYALLIESKMKDNYEKLNNIINNSLEEYIKTFKSIKKYFRWNLHKYSKEDQEKISLYINFYKKERIPKFKKIIDYGLNQKGYLSLIMQIDDEKEKMINKYNEIKEKEMNIKYLSELNDNNENINKKTKKNKHVLGSVLFGLTKGFKEASNNDNEEKRLREDAINELKNGNPDSYVDLYGVLDDDIVGNLDYPIEQEDEDDYD